MIQLNLAYKRIKPIKKKILTGTNEGFTIIELMLASVLFSIVLVILTYGVVRITDIYYRGVAITTTQNVARNIVTDVSQTIEFSGGQVGTADLGASYAGQTQAFCIGNRAYYYQLGYEMVGGTPGIDQGKDALVVLDNDSACPNPTTIGIDLKDGSIPSGGQEMLQPHMRLSKFMVTKSTIANLYNIDIQVTYGSDDSLNNPTNYNGIGNAVTCIGGINTQYCATSELNTSVAMRVE